MRQLSLVKKYILIGLLPIFGLVGCTESVDDTVTPLSANKVIFEVSVDEGSLSRAPKMSARDLTTYAVYGITSAGGKVATNSIYTLVNSDWQTTQDIYWPASTLTTNFFAISGSFADLTTKVSFTKSNRRFTYTTPLNADDQLDLMIASALNMKQETNGGKVQLSFIPIMCYMQIAAYIESSFEYEHVTLGRIAIHNVDVAGKVTFSGTVNNGYEVELQKNYQAIFRDMSENPFELTKTSQVVPNVNEFFMLHMQKLVKWKTKVGAPVSIAEADADHQCYVELDCKIQDDGGNYVYGSDTEWGKVYIPFSAAVSWTKPNTTKTATIKFSGGYDENGIPLSFGSGFEIVAEDWEPGNENNEPIEVEF